MTVTGLIGNPRRVELSFICIPEQVLKYTSNMEEAIEGKDFQTLM